MRTRLWVPGLLLVMSASFASAAPITIPQGLAPGTVYHLAFVTSGSHNALSTDIADYDAFVTAQANLVPDLAALNTTWKVIGSTETVDAIDHIGVVGPVYNTRGQLVVDTLAHMFGGSGLAAPIGYYQDGGAFGGNEYVWTGTSPGGRAAVGAQYLGGPTTQLPPICIPNPFTGQLDCQQLPNYRGPIVGITSATNTFDFSWINETNIYSSSTPLAFYGISGALTVPFPPSTDPPSTVPEPGTMSLMLGPLALLALRRVRRAR